MMADNAPQQPPDDPQNVIAPNRITKTEIDSSTYIKTKTGLRLMCNFTFRINTHSLIPDREGNKIYVLFCGTQDGRIFKVSTRFITFL